MPATRLAVLDFARGLAVVTMAIYHLSWDLSWFSFVDWPVTHGLGWRIFAASIASSFLFLSGIGLDLSHHKGIRWRAFWRRFAVIALAAAAVSLVTYFAFGNQFVRFGILHSIALSSLVVLPFARLPVWSSVLAAVFFLTLPLWASSHEFDGQIWLWTGLGTPDYGSVDYVPLAPWAGATFAGLATSRAFRALSIWERLSAILLSDPLGRFTRLLGRHSLPIYLLHQPVLFGLVWLAVQLGPDIDRAGIAFVRNCTQSCQATGGTPEICEAACSCTLNHLKSDRVWTALTEDPGNQSLRSQMNNRYALCLAEPQSKPAQLN
ncbi:putative membrane protein [Roseibium album]|nr:putative membrane protein [Roseibium album]